MRLADFVIERSAVGAMVVVAVLLSLTVFGSAWSPDTVTRFEMVPVLVGLTRMFTLARLVAWMLPRLQTTVFPDWLQCPWVGVAETKVTEPGKSSVMVTFVALEGPLLPT